MVACRLSLISCLAQLSIYCIQWCYFINQFGILYSSMVWLGSSWVSRLAVPYSTRRWATLSFLINHIHFTTCFFVIKCWIDLLICVGGLSLGFLGIQSKRLAYWVEWSILFINPSILILLANVGHNSIIPPWVLRETTARSYHQTLVFSFDTPELFNHHILVTRVYLWY